MVIGVPLTHPVMDAVVYRFHAVHGDAVFVKSSTKQFEHGGQTLGTKGETVARVEPVVRHLVVGRRASLEQLRLDGEW